MSVNMKSKLPTRSTYMLIFLQNLLRRFVAFMYIVCPLPFCFSRKLPCTDINTGTSLNFSLVRFHITVDCDIHIRLYQRFKKKICIDL